VQLDLCDPARHFQTVVPQRAGSCPILLNAIFALASRHLSQTSDYDPLASNRYHEQCLRCLIPLLDNATTISDENLFAATIILRVLEEMDGTISPISPVRKGLPADTEQCRPSARTRMATSWASTPSSTRAIGRWYQAA
jgi:hypothetical protein